MINPKELRIGNLLNEFHEIVTIHAGGGLKIRWVGQSGPAEETGIRKVKPIPLTEEWLLRFGFIYNGGQGYKSPHSDLHFYGSLGMGYCPHIYYRKIVESDGLIGCKYVHQLQNLYFALTGIELEIIPEL